VVTAPSGTGKTTLLRKLLAAEPGLQFSISYTTRPPRAGEVHGQDYFFVSPEEFRRLRDEGALAEWVEQFGYGYGTCRRWVEDTLQAGADVVFDIETRGARALKQAFPQGTFIFILPPSWEQLELRLQVRGKMDPAEMARRLEQGKAEIREVSWYDFLVINDDLDLALDQLRGIVTASRCRPALLWPQLKDRFFSP
jgi:guanylate kinase